MSRPSPLTVAQAERAKTTLSKAVASNELFMAAPLISGRFQFHNLERRAISGTHPRLGRIIVSTLPGEPMKPVTVDDRKKELRALLDQMRRQPSRQWQEERRRVLVLQSMIAAHQG